MSLQATFFKRTFTFRFDARTSRGAMKDKVSWFIKVSGADRPAVAGLGECGPLPGLSTDHRPDAEMERILAGVTARLQAVTALSPENVFSVARAVTGPGLPAVLFAVETALLDLLHGGRGLIFENNFKEGRRLPINGLIWMGDADFMMAQVHEKVRQGFTCIKLKVGGLDFERECRILQTIRNAYPDITLRLDANGAFSPAEAMDRLKALAVYNIHSIEQPVKPGSAAMHRLCRESPIPIALDEELIGREEDKRGLLEAVRPPFIILKPSLHGGLAHCREWIAIAEEMNTGWWVTSALESNVGLNAVCQFTANYPVTLPQGLGTGGLYTDNFPSPLCVEGGEIFMKD